MELNSNNMKKIMFLIIFTVVVFLVFSNISIVLGFISTVLTVFTPFIVGFSIAFVLNVFLRLIEGCWSLTIGLIKLKFLDAIKRPICIILTMALFVGAVFVVVFIVVPEASKTIEEISKMIPTYTRNIEKWYKNTQADLNKLYLNLPTFDLNKIDWNKIGEQIIGFLTNGGKSIFTTTIGITWAVIGGILTTFISFVFSIYALFNKEKVAEQLKKLVRAYFNERHSEKIISTMRLAEDIFSGFVMGQIVEAIILGLLCFVGMTIFKFPYATMISALIGFLALIPLVGAYLGTTIGALMILMVDPMKALWFVIFFIVLQQLEGNLIYPRVVGKSVGLPGMWVLVAITIGGSVFGIIGILLGVPITSIIYAILRQSVNDRLKEKKLIYYEDEYGYECNGEADEKSEPAVQEETENTDDSMAVEKTEDIKVVNNNGNTENSEVSSNAGNETKDKDKLEE